MVARQLLVPGRLGRVTVAHDLHRDLGRASLPCLPRAKGRVRRSRSYEQVRSKTPCRIRCVEVDELVATDRTVVRERELGDLIKERAKLQVSLGLGHGGAFRKVQRARRAYVPGATVRVTLLARGGERTHLRSITGSEATHTPKPLHDPVTALPLPDHRADRWMTSRSLPHRPRPFAFPNPRYPFVPTPFRSSQLPRER